MTQKFVELEKPGDSLTGRQFLDMHLRHAFALRYAAGKRLLDVGCGTGLGLPVLAEAATSVLAIDQDPVALEFARKQRHPRVQVEAGDAHQLPGDASSRDVVLCLAALMYLDIPKFLAECRRVLVREGWLVGCIANNQGQVFVPSAQSRNYCSLPELDALFRADRFQGKYWGVRYGVSQGKRSLASRAYNVLVPLAMRLVNLLPNPRAVKGWLARTLMRTYPLGEALEASALRDAERACELIEIRADQDTGAFDAIYFAAQRME